MPRKKVSLMGSYNADEREDKAMRWCINNGIRIYPKPTERGTPSRWWLIIEINNRINQSPEEYPRNKVWEKLYEFYNYYYKKYNK
tara:strand:+ start:611 stop:865 length:255 start_codon:yes stop_codon:yes gene_type:complete